MYTEYKQMWSLHRLSTKGKQSVLHISPTLISVVSVWGFLSPVCVISPAWLALLARQVLLRQLLDPLRVSQARSEQANGENHHICWSGPKAALRKLTLQTGRWRNLFFFFLTFYEMKDIPFMRSVWRCWCLDGFVRLVAALILGVSPALTFLCSAVEGQEGRGESIKHRCISGCCFLDRKRNFNTGF